LNKKTSANTTCDNACGYQSCATKRTRLGIGRNWMHLVWNENALTIKLH